MLRKKQNAWDRGCGLLQRKAEESKNCVWACLFSGKVPSLAAKLTTTGHRAPPSPCTHLYSGTLARCFLTNFPPDHKTGPTYGFTPAEGMCWKGEEFLLGRNTKRNNRKGPGADARAVPCSKGKSWASPFQELIPCQGIQVILLRGNPKTLETSEHSWVSRKRRN